MERSDRVDIQLWRDTKWEGQYFLVKGATGAWMLWLPELYRFDGTGYLDAETGKPRSATSWRRILPDNVAEYQLFATNWLRSQSEGVKGVK